MPMPDADADTYLSCARADRGHLEQNLSGNVTDLDKAVGAHGWGGMATAPNYACFVAPRVVA